MILWAIVICAAVGFVLGTQCRLLPLIVASALVLSCGPLVLRATESALVSGGFAILGLLAILQAFFLVGAVVRVSGPPVPLYGWRPWWAARLRAAAAHGADRAVGN